MRAPGEASGTYALECAMDELAAALDLDPVELRRRNEPKIDESSGRPFSSRSLLKCLAVGAERFDWSRRDPTPGSMRDGTPSHGGSWTMASVGTAIRAACLAVRAEAAKRAVGDQRSLVFGAAMEDVEWSEARLRRRGDTASGQSYADIVGNGAPIETRASTSRSPEVTGKFSMYGFGAFFAEVAVDPDVRTIRVRRPVGVKGIGEISIVGVAPAIANAVYHATGKRVRELPIRIENLLET
jgi:CO/xanthine dehydrogenase Mo-binding subunit